MAAVGFAFDPDVGEVSDVQHGTVTPRTYAGKWFVQLDGDVITVRAGHEIGRAAWVQGRVIERTGQPSDEQWKRIGTAIGRVLKRAAPEKRRLPKFLIGPIIVGALAIVAIAVIFKVRTDEVPTIELAKYGDLVWSDVKDGPDVLKPQVLRAAEDGQKLCVDATVDELSLAKLEGRDVHQGRISFGDASVPIVALGSVRTIVTRYAARFCGIADGKRVVGLFDLPDNRSMQR